MSQIVNIQIQQVLFVTTIFTGNAMEWRNDSFDTLLWSISTKLVLVFVQPKNTYLGIINIQEYIGIEVKYILKA